MIFFEGFHDSCTVIKKLNNNKILQLDSSKIDINTQ